MVVSLECRPPQNDLVPGTTLFRSFLSLEKNVPRSELWHTTVVPIPNLILVVLVLVVPVLLVNACSLF